MGGHQIENESGREGRRVRLHHFVVKGADRLDVSHRVGVIFVAEVEVIHGECLHVRRPIRFFSDRQNRVGLVEHEVAAHHVGAVCQTVGVSIVGAQKQQRRRVNGAATNGYDVAGKCSLLPRAVQLPLPRHRRTFPSRSSPGA